MVSIFIVGVRNKQQRADNWVSIRVHCNLLHSGWIDEGKYPIGILLRE